MEASSNDDCELPQQIFEKYSTNMIDQIEETIQQSWNNYFCK